MCFVDDSSLPDLRPATYDLPIALISRVQRGVRIRKKVVIIIKNVVIIRDEGFIIRENVVFVITSLTAAEPE